METGISTRLNLNEAQVNVNRSTISSALDVYFQISECFGCQLSKLKTLTNEIDNFTIGTKFNLQLELRKSSANVSSVSKCRFDDLALNSQGQYQIDVTEPSPSGDLKCSFKTLDKGECLWCPFAILTCAILLIIILEKIQSRFWRPNEQRQMKRLSVSAAAAVSNGNHSDSSASTLPSAIESNISTTQAQANGSAAELMTSSHEINIANGDTTAHPVSRESLSGNFAPSMRRVDALDAFRGITIAGMILVNNGGAGYVMLEHKAWDGITLADFVFPFFIFAMGASIAISTRSLVGKRKKTFQEVSVKVFRRSMILASIGLCLNSKWLNYSNSNLNSLRLTGVLQRFAGSYLVVALMYTIELTVNKWIKAQSISQVPLLSKSVGVLFELLTAINYLAIYVFVSFFFEYNPDCPIGYTGPGGLTEGGRFANCTGGAAAWLDKLVLGDSHLYHGNDVKEIFKTQISHDPEGILGYTTSVLLTLIGLQCGKILIKRHEQQSVHKQRLVALIQWIALLAISCSLVAFIPINKRLWSLTFILTTGMVAFILILILYVLLDIYSVKRTLLMRLLISAGKNSIFLYVGHSLLAGMLPWWFPVDQSSHLQLLMRVSWSTFVWLLVAHYMALKQMFIKV